MMYDTDYAIYQYINAQVEQYVEFDDLLKQNHCTMEEAQQEIKAFREKYHSLLAGYAFSDCDLAAACEELMAQMEQHPGSLDLQYLYLCIVTDFGLLWNAGVQERSAEQEVRNYFRQRERMQELTAFLQVQAESMRKYENLLEHLKKPIEGNQAEYAEESDFLYHLTIQHIFLHDGIKNEKGVYVTPAFPKLIYVLDEHNCLKGGKYDYITKLAVKCSAKRLYPDYISAKKMRENYEGNVFSCMGCRSFLSPWKDENGNYKWEGRFNQGVVSLNLPQIGILAKGNEEKFWSMLDERLDLCYEALMCRHNALLGVTSDVSPVHWQYGAIARLKKGEKIDPLLKDGYSTISLGYIGLYEVTKLMTGKSHTEPEGEEFALRVMNRLRKACDTWKEETGLGFGLYGTPAESLCYRFARIDQERFGTIEDVTDKGYYTNSYHVDVREKIDAFSKFRFESQFQTISSGGAISYVEIPNMRHNLEALEEIVRFIYDNIQYAEFNTKSDYCHVCDYDGEIMINDDNEWECPQCGNKDHSKMNVTRRTCGYLGENFWNVGKTKEIKARVLHL